MTDEELLSVFRQELVNVSPERKDDFAKVGLDTPFEDVGLDSLTMLEMVSEVESRLDITFEDDDLEVLTNLRGLLDLVRKMQAQ